MANLEISGYIELCLIKKLENNVDDSNLHNEYNIRNQNLDLYINNILSLIPTIRSDDVYEITQIILLYHELNCNSIWNDQQKGLYAKHINDVFEKTHNVSVHNILKQKRKITDQIFDSCLNRLHQNITKDLFKLYPGSIEVYCTIIKELEEYHVTIYPAQILPASLTLMDDYSIEYKSKGLQCCLKILECLTWSHFVDGNYCEVVYQTLLKNIVEKDQKVTDLVLKCLFQIISILKNEDKIIKYNELYQSILEQLHLESNVYRKSILLKYVDSMHILHGINCGKKKKAFMSVLDINLKECFNSEIRLILFSNIIKCLESWLTTCWPMWKFQDDHKQILNLLKILYLTQNYDSTSDKIIDFIKVMIMLCTEEEIKLIANNISKFNVLQNQEFSCKMLKLYSCIMSCKE